MKALLGGVVLTPGRRIEDGVVLTEGQRITAVGPRGLMAIPPEAEVVDAREGYICPGFVDIHCHGAIGVDPGAEGTTVADLHRVAAFKAGHGTTSFLLATAAASPESTAATLALIHRAVGARGGAELLGAQAEGPFFNPEARGAQAAEHLRPPSIDEFEEWLRLCPELKLVSLAPEMEGALEFIRHAASRGVTVSVGHSMASYEQVEEAVKAGMRHATHTFNGMLGLHHRRPGTAGAILTDDRIMAEAVVDNIHLHPATVDLILRCKGPDQVALVTDAVTAAGLPDGEHTWDGRRVTVSGGVVTLDDGTIAGSTLTMDRAVRNLVADTGASLGRAVQMATLNPAVAIGVADRKGSLDCGKDADIVVLDRNLEVELTLVRGKIVYRREGETADV